MAFPQNVGIATTGIATEPKVGTNLERETSAFPDAETWERVPSNSFRDTSRSQEKAVT